MMSPELIAEIVQLVVVVIGMLGLWLTTRNRRTDATTATIAADAKQVEAVAKLALENNQERRELWAEVLALRDKVSYAQGQSDQVQKIASEKIEALEKQMKELGVTSDARILFLENEIKGLNTIIAARDETITELKKQVKQLSETVEKFLAAQAAPAPTTTTATQAAGAIPIELTVSGGISAISPPEKPPQAKPPALEEVA